MAFQFVVLLLFQATCYAIHFYKRIEANVFGSRHVLGP